MNIKMMSLAIVAGVAASAHADTVSFRFGGVSRGLNLGISDNGNPFYNVYAGSVIHDINGQRAVTYCIDPDQWAQTGTRSFERDTLEGAFSSRPQGAAKAAIVAELADVAGADIWSESGDRNLAAAFQLAVWEVILDYDAAFGVTSLDLDSGNFMASGTSGSSLALGVRNEYDNLIGGLSFGGASTARYEAYTNTRYQDFMTVIPAPATAVLGLVALPMIASRRRR